MAWNSEGMNYFCKVNDDDKPISLFRADGLVEEAWGIHAWQPAPGFLEDIVLGSFHYGPIEEQDARAHFPEAFA